MQFKKYLIVTMTAKRNHFCEIFALFSRTFSIKKRKKKIESFVVWQTGRKSRRCFLKSTHINMRIQFFFRVTVTLAKVNNFDVFVCVLNAS